MSLNSTVMRAVEQLSYRVTAGDVSAQTGLDVKLAEQDLLALASAAGGHLQVSESGEIAYQFSQDFRGVLRNKYFRLRLQEWWQRIWGVLLYLIRIAFGIMLLVSIVLIVVAILIILTAASASQRDDRNSSPSIRLPAIWISPGWYHIFYPNYGRYRSGGWERGRRDRTSYKSKKQPQSQMNFLEAIFSFLFGDGNPNADLEERRWRAIAAVIRNHDGAVVAEHIAPYLDDLGSGYRREYEDYMLPVLVRFNGRPEVTPEGGFVYHFPELQVSADRQETVSVPPYLKERPWAFSQASSSQIAWALGLGLFNFIGAIALGFLLLDRQVTAELGDFITFVRSIYGLLLAYGTGFLVIPAVRYFWLKGRNRRIEQQNAQREEHAIALKEADEPLQQKITYAQQFAAETVVSRDNLVYTTESDLLEQEAQQRDRIDAEWQQRLNESDSSK